jgi:hypothetical protein
MVSRSPPVGRNLKFFFLTLWCDNKRDLIVGLKYVRFHFRIALVCKRRQFYLLKYVPWASSLLSLYVAYYMRQLLRHCYEAGQQIIQAQLPFAHSGKDQFLIPLAGAAECSLLMCIPCCKEHQCPPSIQDVRL